MEKITKRLFWVLIVLAIVSVAVVEGFSQNSMLIPPTLSGNTFNLTLQNGTHQFYSGVTTNTMGANGNILGPTLIMEQGEFVNITVENLIGETTTIHWHGMHVSAQNDGGPHTVIQPNATWNPQFTVLDKASTFWYHPHLHEKTNDHVQKGIAGFIIVRDSEEAALDLPRTYGEDDFPIVLQTKAFDGAGQIVVETELDTVVIVNGTRKAFLDLPAQTVRLRLLNGASQRSFNVALSNGANFYQIGTDGGLLEAPVQLTELLLSPGERAEILLDLSGMQGQNFSVMSNASNIPLNIYGAATVIMGPSTIPDYPDNPLNGADFVLFDVNVTAPTSTPVISIPRSLVTLTPYLEADVDVTRNITLSPVNVGPLAMVAGPYEIDDASFDMNVINHTVQLDDIEIWSIANQTGVAHPFHIHDVQFFILDIDGNPPPANLRGWKDVVLVPRQQTVRFITKFEDFADDEVPYMYHCHMLTHEDDGMMGQFIVMGEPTGVEETATENEPRFYPNPITDGMLNMDFISGEFELMELYSMDGKLLFSQNISGQNSIQKDVKTVNGNFIVRLIRVDGKHVIKSIINHK
ncbi:MAG: multicopper oxidase domain-containing protein [Flavobacteriales bacterium]|nr:multicopper oxidase domain-containing protein [Flavobacteriales bacterium]